MEQPGLPVVIALVHGVHPQIAWSAPWIGFAPLGNALLRRWGVGPAPRLAAVTRRVAQFKNRGHRDPRQSLILHFSEHVMLPLHHTPRRRSGRIFMRRIHSRQQSDVGGRVSSRKTRPASGLAFDSPDLHPTADPSRQLRSAQSGHLHQKTTHDSFLASTDTAILLRFQNPFDELINRFPLWCGKADASTPLHKLPYLVYRQSFYVLHGDIHSPAALHPFPPLPFRLIPHWK